MSLTTFTSALPLVKPGVRARTFGIGFNPSESLLLFVLKFANISGRFSLTQRLSKTTSNFASCVYETDM